MGTSQSNPGPGGNSPLVPPWADDQAQPAPIPTRFKPFRESLGGFVSSGDRSDLRRALGHYARSSTGGGSTAARRMGGAARAGGNLFGILAGSPPIAGSPSVDISNLAGLPCDVAISKISQALTTDDGDSDKIRIAMNHALVEALDGVEVFDPSCITDDVIINTMIGYLSESIFLQIVMDSAKAWNKAETPQQASRAEAELRELVKVIVDKHMAPKLSGNIRSLTREQMTNLEQQSLVDVWREWEAYS